jgi:hypothetical protein
VRRKKPRPSRSTRGTSRKKTSSATRRAARRAPKKARGKKAAPRKTGRKAAPRKTGRKAAPRKTARKPKPAAKASRPSSPRPRARLDHGWERGLGPEAGGQSGDTEQISRAEIADSESVEELLEEGQAFEAGVVEGVENAPDADQGEVRTREVPEDDVPEEYLGKD